MTISEVRWAMDHDWYENNFRTGSGLSSYSVTVSEDGTVIAKYFDNYMKLREWAGY